MILYLAAAAAGAFAALAFSNREDESKKAKLVAKVQAYLAQDAAGGVKLTPEDLDALAAAVDGLSAGSLLAISLRVVAAERRAGRLGQIAPQIAGMPASMGAYPRVAPLLAQPLADPFLGGRSWTQYRRPLAQQQIVPRWTQQTDVRGAPSVGAARMHFSAQRLPFAAYPRNTKWWPQQGPQASPYRGGASTNIPAGPLGSPQYSNWTQALRDAPPSLRTDVR